MRGFGVENRRHELYRVVKTFRYIKVCYRKANIDMYIESYVETCEIENFEQLIKGQISIICPDIYWYSTEMQIAEYSQILGAFHFIFPDYDKPFPIGKYNTQNMMTVVNNGDDVGFTLEISGGFAKIQRLTILKQMNICRFKAKYKMAIKSHQHRYGKRRLSDDFQQISHVLLERRIIYSTCSFTSKKSYSDIIYAVASQNVIHDDNRRIPELSLGSVSGECWNRTTKLQGSYDNLMEWIYTICEKIGGTANIRLKKISSEQYEIDLF